MTEISDKIQNMNQVLTHPDRPWLFQKGQSGNPLGRPKGSKNKISQLLQSISEDDQKVIADRLIGYAKDGGYKFFLAALPYIIPKAKAPNVAMIADDAEVLDIKLDTLQDIKQASEMVIKAMITGRISVAEAQGMMGIIERYKTILAA